MDGPAAGGQNGAVYQVLLGLAVVVAFERLARFEGEPPALWSTVAGLAFFVPGILLGPMWGIGGALVVGGAFCWRVMARPPSGKGPIR